MAGNEVVLSEVGLDAIFEDVAVVCNDRLDDKE